MHTRTVIIYLPVISELGPIYAVLSCSFYTFFLQKSLVLNIPAVQLPLPPLVNKRPGSSILLGSVGVLGYSLTGDGRRIARDLGRRLLEEPYPIQGTKCAFKVGPGRKVALSGGRG